MRTTLTLEPDVAERLELETRQTGRKMKAVVNEALRVGLGIEARDVPRFQVQPHPMGLRPGLDGDRMNQLLDELETEERIRKMAG